MSNEEQLPEPTALPWNASLPVSGRSSLQDIMTCLAFGRPNDPTYPAIAAKFEARSINTVTKLQDFQGSELVSMVRTLNPQKHARAYVAAIGTAINHDFFAVHKGGVKSESAQGEAPGQGSQWASHCTKQNVSHDFNPGKYIPDGRVYAQLPSVDSKSHLDEDESFLISDLVWIDAQANPEPSLGEYIPPVRAPCRRALAAAALAAAHSLPHSPPRARRHTAFATTLAALHPP